MNLNIANASSMCSTLILGGFKLDYDPLPYTLRIFVGDLKAAIEQAEKPSTKRTVWNRWATENKAELQILDNYKVADYALVVGTIYLSDSTETLSQNRAKENLAKLGFQISGPYYNKKNKTDIFHFMIDTKSLLEELDKYDAEGDLIEENIECAA